MLHVSSVVLLILFHILCNSWVLLLFTVLQTRQPPHPQDIHTLSVETEGLQMVLVCVCSQMCSFVYCNAHPALVYCNVYRFQTDWHSDLFCLCSNFSQALLLSVLTEDGLSDICPCHCCPSRTD